MRKIGLFVLIVLFFSSCGYTPSSKFSRQVLGERVSTSVVISQVDPENTVLVKDAVDAAIVEVLQASLVSKAQSDSHLKFSISKPGYKPIQYDDNGYVIAYRMTVRLNITRITDGKQKNYSTQGSYDFSITPNAVVTDQDRFDAIRLSATKAINAFIAKLSAEGAIQK